MHIDAATDVPAHAISYRISPTASPTTYVPLLWNHYLLGTTYYCLLPTYYLLLTTY